MSIWVKICGNTSLEDAWLAAEAGADAVGFVFAPSPRRVTGEQVALITPRLPDALEKIGVFTDTTLDQIEATVRSCGLSGVQLQRGRRRATAFHNCGRASDSGCASCASCISATARRSRWPRWHRTTILMQCSWTHARLRLWGALASLTTGIWPQRSSFGTRRSGDTSQPEVSRLTMLPTQLPR